MAEVTAGGLPAPQKIWQDSDHAVHQYWYGDTLPDGSIVQEPVYYRINLQVSTHSFSSS